MHSTLRIKPTDFHDLLSFQLETPAGYNIF